MAIDPKELRIGSHVEYKGERWEVAYITPKTKVLYYALFQKNRPLLEVFPLEVNPIPITAELLEELGFEKARFKSYRRDLGELHPFMHFHYIADGCWRMEVSDDTRNYGNIVCKYLHQVEAFLYLTTKQELIND